MANNTLTPIPINPKARAAKVLLLAPVKGRLLDRVLTAPLTSVPLSDVAWVDAPEPVDVACELVEADVDCVVDGAEEPAVVDVVPSATGCVVVA